MERFKYLIIGAGPTGLGAAYRLSDLGEKSFLVIEKTNRVGGLATSYRDDAGFTWDIGGHVHFSHYRYYDEALERTLPPESWSTFHRESWVWINGHFVPYPFQYNIRHLPGWSRWNCLLGIWRAWVHQSACPPRHFEDWIMRTFGPGIARTFMLPYNFKVWAYPLAEMSYEWIGERVSVVNPWRVTQNMLFRIDDREWGPNATFRFPKKGGTGAIWEAMAATIGSERLRRQAEVFSIDSKQKKIRLASGNIIEYDHLLSTMPLDILVRNVSELPSEILSKVQRLKHSTTHIVGIGLRGTAPERLRSKSWMYFPEDNCPFYRVTVFSNYSVHHTPDPAAYWSLLTETSDSPHKMINHRTLIDNTIKGLLNTRLIASEKEIVSIWNFVVDYGYPTPSIDRNDILRTVSPCLESREIYSRGRFGAWRYEVSNQDHSFMQGVEWVNRMISGVPESIVSS